MRVLQIQCENGTATETHTPQECTWQWNSEWRCHLEQHTSQLPPPPSLLYENYILSAALLLTLWPQL